MTKFLIALAAGIGLYVLLFTLLPITQATAIILPWLEDLGEFSFGAVSSVGVFAIIMGK
jgi:uncharacterized membrane protein YdbT with pleckstrin-like domain